MKFIIALVMVFSISGVCDAKCRRLGRIFGKRAVRPACTVVSVPACGTFVAEVAPVEVVIIEQQQNATQLEQQVVTQRPDIAVVEREVAVPPAPSVDTPLAVPTPTVSAEEIIGATVKPPRDDSPTINFRLK